MPNHIDKPSANAFIEAIVKNVPKQATKQDLDRAGAEYIAAKVVKRVIAKKHR